MNALETVAGFMGGYIVPFILVLSLLVFVHEMVITWRVAGRVSVFSPSRSASGPNCWAGPTATEPAGRFRSSLWAAMCASMATTTPPPARLRGARKAERRRAQQNLQRCKTLETCDHGRSGPIANFLLAHRHLRRDLLDLRQAGQRSDRLAGQTRQRGRAGRLSGG